MPFFGLYIARSALLAHRAAVNVTAQNVANAQTCGYVRQRAELAPIAVSPGSLASAEASIGGGVELVTVSRVRSEFLQSRLDRALGHLGEQRQLSEALDQVESLFLDLTGQGPAQLLAAFFNAWEQLATNPESQPLRLAVREAGNTLAAGIRTRYRELQDHRAALDEILNSKVARVNDIIAEIAQLNRRIVAEGMSAPPNDLLSRVDLLVEELSALIGVTSIAQPNGSRDVLLGGIHLVQGATASVILAEPDPNNANLLALRLANTDVPIAPPTGELAALLAVRDQFIPSYMADLDTFVTTLTNEFNARHRLGIGLDGSTGTDFFTATCAADIRLSDAVLASLDAIAASKTGAVGDGNHAAALSRMRDELLLSGGTETLSDFYESLVGRIGLDGQLATDALERQEALVDDLQARRDGVSAVSLDEEAINLMRFQQAHNAAARLVSTIDQMIQAVLSIGSL